jgi:hypothetical protein
MARQAWRGRRTASSLTGLVLAVVLALLIGTGLSELFGVASAQGVDAGQVAALLALILAGAVTGALVFDVHHGVAALLVDSDLDLLRRSPLRPAALFALKLLDSLPRTTVLVVLVALPAVVAWVNRFPLPPWALALIPLQLAGLWSVPLGIGVALATWLLKSVPSRRAREAFGLLSTFVLAAVWLANAFLVPRLAEAPSELADALRAATGSGSPLVLLSPGHTVAEALLAAHQGDAARSIWLTLWLSMLGGVALAVAAFVVGRSSSLLQSALGVAYGRRRAHEAPSVARGGRATPRGVRGAWAKLSSNRTMAIVRKDIRLFARDWTALADVLAMGVLWALLPLLSRSMMEAGPGLFARASLVALTIGLGHEIGARTAPLERGGAMWSRLAPVSPAAWASAKFLGACVLASPVLAMAGLGIAMALPIPPRESLGVWITGASALSVSLALGLWAGLRHGDPEWTNPRGMMSLHGRILLTLLLLANAGAWLVLADPLADPPARRLWTDVWLPPLVALLATGAILKSCRRAVISIGWPH